MQSIIEWIDWSNREPFVDEALLVIFRHKGTGICHLQVGSVIRNPYWFDYEPVCWTSNVQLPQEIIDSNKVLMEKMQESWDKYKKNKAGLPSG